MLTENAIEKNFGVCPHCTSKGTPRVLHPATPHRTPVVSRSDGTSFHLFLEESWARRPSNQGIQLVALYRYDLEPAQIKSESTLVIVQIPENKPEMILAAYEQVADRLAMLLARGQGLSRQYLFPY